MTVVEAYEDIAAILAHLGPKEILAMKAPVAMAERVALLTAKRKMESLSSEEQVELERYLSLDLLINLAKARAQQLLDD